MLQKKLVLSWEEVEVLMDLIPVEVKLLALAKSSLENAYAPYSNFHVGAAILLENGKMLGGSGASSFIGGGISISKFID